MRRTLTVLTSLLLLSCCGQLQAQNQASGDTMAQKLVDSILAKHRPELLYLALHVVPPEGTESAAVAATLRDKIGKKSSCADLHVLEDKVPVMELKGAAGNLVDGTVIGSTVLAPLHDRTGNVIGLINIGMSYGTGQESEAAKFSRSIEQEVAQGISTKPALFEPAH